MNKTAATVIQKSAHAHRGFTLDGTGMQNVKCYIAPDGGLWLEQGNDKILVPRFAFAAFKNAVATLGEIP